VRDSLINKRATHKWDAENRDNKKITMPPLEDIFRVEVHHMSCIVVPMRNAGEAAVAIQAKMVIQPGEVPRAPDS
jgi:hypothetical protein